MQPLPPRYPPPVLISHVPESPISVEISSRSCRSVIGAAESEKTPASRVRFVTLIGNLPSCLQFIDLASGLSLRAGITISTPMDGVQLADEFTPDGRAATLIDIIDTPGFDDTPMSDTDTPGVGAAFLATT